MKLKLLLLLLSFYSINAFACLSAKQHKLFPVGVIDDNLIFIEAHIYRTEDRDINDKERHLLKVKWIIKSYVTIYDKSQKLISRTEIEEDVIKGDSYLPLLQATYTRGLFQVKSLYSELDYFKADYLSFCDYQKKCSKVELISDSIAKKDFLKYKDKSYRLKLNTTEKEAESATFTDDLSFYYINSIRVYKTKDLEIVVGHIATGHEVSMGYIVNDPNKKTTEDGMEIKEREPYLPDFEFKEIYTAVYQEPIMHHGYGYDLFIIKVD